MKLITKRLILRDLEKKDSKDLIENVNNLKVSRYTELIPYPYTTKDSKWFVSKCLKDRKKKNRENYELGIELKSNKKLIGMVSLSGVNDFSRTASLGYWLGEKYWRQGIMSEAVNKMLDFGFNKLRLRRIDVSAYPGNKGSNVLIKKMGFIYEGMKKKAVKVKSTGKIYDENFYGLLKEGWIKQRLKLIKK